MEKIKIKLVVENGTSKKNNTIRIYDTDKAILIYASNGIQVSARVVNDNLTGLRLEKQSDSINLLLVIPENGHLWGDIMILPINEKNGTKELWLKFILDDENSVCKTFMYTIYEK